MKNLTTISQLQKNFQLTEFVKKTIQQINKDLNGLLVMQVFLADENSINKLEELISNLVPVLTELERRNQLQQYIYQVDLKEKYWMTFLTNQNYRDLSENIIIREAQKVFLRETYKSL